jgi:hypothetical protein
MRHQKIDMLLIQDVGSGQSVRLLVSQLYQHGTLNGLGRFRAATAQASNSIVSGANSLLVPLEERAAENRSPYGNVILGSSAPAFPNQYPVVDGPDLHLDVLESVSFYFDLKNGE